VLLGHRKSVINAANIAAAVVFVPFPKWTWEADVEPIKRLPPQFRLQVLNTGQAVRYRVEVTLQPGLPVDGTWSLQAARLTTGKAPVTPSVRCGPLRPTSLLLRYGICTFDFYTANVCGVLFAICCVLRASSAALLLHVFLFCFSQRVFLFFFFLSNRSFIRFAIPLVLLSVCVLNPST